MVLVESRSKREQCIITNNIPDELTICADPTQIEQVWLIYLLMRWMRLQVLVKVRSRLIFYLLILKKISGDRRQWKRFNSAVLQNYLPHLRPQKMWAWVRVIHLPFNYATVWL